MTEALLHTAWRRQLLLLMSALGCFDEWLEAWSGLEVRILEVVVVVGCCLYNSPTHIYMQIKNEHEIDFGTYI